MNLSDSFSDGGDLYSDHRLNKNKILNKVKEMLIDGADIIDLGGESTRPGAEPVSVQEEQDRVIPVLSYCAIGSMPFTLWTQVHLQL